MPRAEKDFQDFEPGDAHDHGDKGDEEIHAANGGGMLRFRPPGKGDRIS